MDPSESEFNLLLPLMGALFVSPIVIGAWLLLRHFDRKSAISIKTAEPSGKGVASAVIKTFLGLILFLMGVSVAIFVVELIKSVLSGK